jgi:hypothetical protein
LAIIIESLSMFDLLFVALPPEFPGSTRPCCPLAKLKISDINGSKFRPFGASIAIRDRFLGGPRMRKLFLLAAVAGTLSVLSITAFACGESMFRVGKGVHYRAYSAPIPGLILVYARTDSERSIADSLR